MPHLIRAGVILAAGLVIALTLRTFLTPEPLLLSSTYRQENVGEWTGAGWPVRLVGASYCADCHKDQAGRWQASKHSGVPCQDCHGATQPHLDHRASLVVDLTRESCGACHARNPVGPQTFPQVDLETHWPSTPCAACHNPHDPWAYRPSRITHDVVGYQNCLGCHGAQTGVGGAKPAPPDHASYGNNRCQSCHQRG